MSGPVLTVPTSFYCNPDLVAMPLEQQAVFFRLLFYSGATDGDAGFETESLRQLARHVANGNEDVLKATLDYLIDDWNVLHLHDDQGPLIYEFCLPWFSPYTGSEV